MDDLFRSRRIIRRIRIEAILVLKSPAHFGGDVDEFGSDMSLALDPLEGTPVIWGTSIAGAFRNYVNEREFGYPDGSKEYQKNLNDKSNLTNTLFGFQEKNQGEQSFLVVEDAFPCGDDDIDFRDMVAIDPKTRTALDEHKYDADLVAAGTKFRINFEIIIPEEKVGGSLQTRILTAAALALEGLEKGEIPLGAKMSRGWGECQASDWKVADYDLHQPAALLAWLEGEFRNPKADEPISNLLGVDTKAIDARRWCRFEVKLKLTHPMMIGSATDDPKKPDSEHLVRKIVGQQPEYIISGTSIAGVLRHRANKVLKTIGKDGVGVDQSLWGYFDKEHKTAQKSRIRFVENAISNAESRVQTRIKINPFTGGTVPGALFDQCVIVPSGYNTYTLEMTIINPQKMEIGLVLLCIKDLCMGDLSIGGGWGIGRGFLQGTKVTLEEHSSGKIEVLEFSQDENGTLSISEIDAEQLESFVGALHKGG